MTTEPVRIAMWSCSRNCSTATMRAWDARADTRVFDEPLYASWLLHTGAMHPMRATILAAHEPDWRRVVEQLTSATGAPIVYEKHISKHLLPEHDWSWLRTHRHAFLIRDPHAMLLSFQRKVEHVTLEETGLPQQATLWKWLRAETGVESPVVDARELLTNPAYVLQSLCDSLEVPYDPTMLRWKPGRRPTDGVWASHWYDAVEQSSGFRAFTPATGTLTPELETIRRASMPAYRFLHARRIRLPDA